MRNPTSNFHSDIFPEHSGFRSIHAHTLPGRVRDPREYMGWTWPRFHTQPLLDTPLQPNYHATRPSIFGPVFEPPLQSDRTEISKHSDKWVITLRSPAFRSNSAKVQVRGGKLVVCAQSSRQSPHAVEGNAFEYSVVLPRGFKAAKIAAKRKDDELIITVPIE
ncbi:hypothetical protein GGH96_000331 [Coemansia sp. RSA 1972]|nr:hypothetical protein GGH96_000331 [Coemansia sp. RSA 1972]